MDVLYDSIQVQVRTQTTSHWVGHQNSQRQPWVLVMKSNINRPQRSTKIILKLINVLHLEL